MNLSGAANERATGRTLMPLFHAMFSLGTVAGAGFGALLAHLQIAVVWHLAVISTASAVLLCWAIPRLQSESQALTATHEKHHDSWIRRLAVWKQPLTLLIGLIVLGTAFTTARTSG
jgi:hypothetical protein